MAKVRVENQEVKRMSKFAVVEKQFEYKGHDDITFKTLGSQAEEMYERGYDEADIREREKYERWLSRQSDMLEAICCERGITLWE